MKFKMEDIVLYFSLKYDGEFNQIYESICNKEQVDEVEFNQLVSQVNSQYTTIFSDDYPKALRHIDNPPFVLYYYGDLSLMNKKTIAVVGMREPSEYGIRATDLVSKELAENGYTVISGLAKGIDTIAHETAIKAGGNTVAVLPTGIDNCYPIHNKELYKKMKESQLIVSEYPSMTQPRKHTFSYRNRIIAGLSDSILISECKEMSSSLLTASFGIEQGKDIYAIPIAIDSPNQGSNSLIKNGAFTFTCVEDILEQEIESENILE